MSDEGKEYTVKVTRIEGYKFEVDFGPDYSSKMLVDEDPPLGTNDGPDPSRMLAASIAHCTLSSLLFCMQKSKAEVGGIDATAKIRFGRDENRRLRIDSIGVTARVSVNEVDRTKLERCLPLFENFCTVSQSVKRGIPITTEIKLV